MAKATKPQIQTTIATFIVPEKGFAKVDFQKGTRKTRADASAVALGDGFIAITVIKIEIEMTKTAKKT